MIHFPFLQETARYKHSHSIYSSILREASTLNIHSSTYSYIFFHIQTLIRQVPISGKSITLKLTQLTQKFILKTLAPVSLFLAAKVEEQPRKLEHIIKVSQICIYRENVDPKSEVHILTSLNLFNIIKITFTYDRDTRV